MAILKEHWIDWLLAGVLAALLMAAPGCTNPLIDVWADRGLEGVANARQALLAFGDARAADLQAQRAADIEAIFADLKALAAAPADPNKPPAITPADLDIQKTALLIQLKAGQDDAQKLQAAIAKALDNLDQTGECFHQVKRLRRSWGTDDQVEARLVRLTALVETLLTETRRTAP